MQLFPSPITPGSQQNPFSFTGFSWNSQMVSNPGDQNQENSGLPNFQFLAAPGQYCSIQNPFSATRMSSLQNFQMATPSVDILDLRNYAIFRIWQIRISLFQMQQI